jgi:hypothetical protein
VIKDLNASENEAIKYEHQKDIRDFLKKENL